MTIEKTYYYKDELNDEFSGIEREHKKIGNNFLYVHHNILWNIGAFFCYRIICTPIAHFYLKFKFHIKIENRELLKPYHKIGYFLYGNHTNVPADGFLPSMITFPKRCYVIVSPENISVRGTETFMMMIGAMPIPSSLHAMKNFIQAIEKRTVQHHCVTVYPEAHIWPYYTKIRPFKSDSLGFPVKFNDPSFCFTVTYQKQNHTNKPKMVVYLDGPFYPDMKLTQVKQKEDLRKRIYEKMSERSKNSNCEYVHYEKATEQKAEDNEK